ncbi:HEAT repeat domain-containing protein [Streptacidiphilus sp. PAMC 29251]
MNALHRALEALTDRTPRTRDIAAAELGDLLRGHALDAPTAVLVVARLVAFTVNEPDRTVRESALNSISEAFNHYRLPLELFTALVPELEGSEPELIGHTLYILGATQDPAAAALIRPLLGHADPSVREEAVLALTEIP